MAALVIAGILANMALSIGTSMRGYYKHRQAKALVEDYQVVLTLASHLSLEKIPAIELLMLDVTSARRRKIDFALRWERSLTNRANLKMREVLCEDDVCRGDINTIDAALDDVRDRVRAVANMDRIDRRGSDIRDALGTSYTAFGAIQPLVTSIKQELISEGGDLSGLAADAHLAIELHALGGDALAHALPPIFDLRPLSMVEREEIKGIIKQIRGLFAFLPRSDDLSDQPAYADALRQVEDVMLRTGLPFLEEIASGNHSGTTPDTLADWISEIYVPALGTLDGLREYTLMTMIDRAAENQAAALRRLWISVAVGLSSSLAILLMVLQVRRSLAGPFREVRVSAARLANDENIDTGAFTSRIAEFRGLFDALSILDTRLKERRELMTKLRLQAETDAMTGLLNRMHFEKLATRAIAGCPGAHCGIIYVDIDEFKTINDTYGHQIGDEILIAIARRLAVFSAHDVLVGRMGGDEFALCCSDMPPKDRDAMAHDIAETIGNITIAEAPKVSINASIGLSRGSGGADRFGNLCREADMALYASKRSGRNRVTWYEDDHLP